jgi:hypothetical protein
MEGGGEKERERESHKMTESMAALPGQVESQCLVLTVLRGLLKDHVSPESIAEIQHNAIEGLGELEASLVLIEQSGQ